MFDEGPDLQALTKNSQGAVSIRKTVLLGMVIPMLKIRRPTGRLIFNMGIPIPGKTVFYIETGPWTQQTTTHFLAISKTIALASVCYVALDVLYPLNIRRYIFWFILHIPVVWGWTY